MAVKANLLIDQGSNFITTISLTDDFDNVIDLTGYTGAAQIRKHYTSIVSYPFVVTITPLTGAVTLQLTSAVSNSMLPGRYVYDCELTQTSTGNVSRIVEGIVTVTPGVTI